MATNPLRQILLENSTSLAERQSLIKMEALEGEKVDNVMISNLYKLAIEKSNIDFDTIPDSKGDITKYEGYKNMVECLNVVKGLANDYGTKVKELEIVETAINNIVNYRAEFTKGFLLGKSFIILLYNLLVSACVEATSIIISSYVDFVKTPTKVEYELIKVPGKLSHTSLDSLENFNATVKSGEFSKVMRTVCNDKENLLGSEVLVPAFIIIGIVSLVPIMRELTYYFYYSRMTTSEYLKHQAQLLEFNKTSVKNSNLPAQKKKDVLRRQAKVAETFLKISDKIKVDGVSTDKKVKTEIDRENRNIKVSDVRSQASGISNIDTSQPASTSGFQLM